jgi:LEA14-like dessication related protein
MKKLIVFILLITIASVSAYFYFRTHIQIPEFIAIQSVELEKIDKNESVIQISLLLKNNNLFKAQLINSELDAEHKQIKFAQLSQTKIIDIPGNSNFSLPFTLKVEPLKLLEAKGISGIVAQILDSKQTLNVHFTGYSRIKIEEKVYKVPIDFYSDINFR